MAKQPITVGRTFFILFWLGFIITVIYALAETFQAHADSSADEFGVYIITTNMHQHVTQTPIFTETTKILTSTIPIGFEGMDGNLDEKPLNVLSTPKFLTLPFPDVGVQLTQGWICHFGADICGLYTPYGAHHAVDYAKFSGGVPVTFNVLAAASGTATCYPQGSRPGFSGYGNMIQINHDGVGIGYSTLYGHLPNCEFTSRYVQQGERIGSAGNTGVSTGIHLHFELRDTSFSRVDPYDLWTTIYSYPQPGQSSPYAGSNHYWMKYPPSFSSFLYPAHMHGFRDVTGDGLADLVAFNPTTGAADVTRSTGSDFGGGYAGYEVWNTNTKYGTDWNLIGLADVTGDGLADLVAFNPTTGAADVTRSTGSDFGGGYAGYEVWNTNTKYGTDWNLIGLTDVTGDGLADLVAFNPTTGAVDVTRSTGSDFGGGYAGYEVWNTNTKYGADWNLIGLADVTGDGLADLVAFNPTTGAVDVTRSTGSDFGGGYAGYEVWNTNTGYSSGWYIIGLADVTGDGLADLVAFNPTTGAVDVTRSTGSDFGGGYAGYEVWNTNTKYGADWNLIGLADVTGDGLADLVAFNPTTGAADVTRSTGSDFGGGYAGYEVWNTNTKYGTDWLIFHNTQKLTSFAPSLQYDSRLYLPLVRK